MRACIQGFINWITSDETSVRDASGYSRGERPFRATLLHLFLSVQRIASRFILHLLLVLLLLLSLSPSTSSSRDLASFAETGYENWRTRESRSLLSVPRAPTWPISTSNSSHVSDPGDKTLLVREIKRDPRRLVNTGTGWSFIRFYDTQTYMIRFRCISPLWASHFLEHPFFWFFRYSLYICLILICESFLQYLDIIG